MFQPRRRLSEGHQPDLTTPRGQKGTPLGMGWFVASHPALCTLVNSFLPIYRSIRIHHTQMSTPSIHLYRVPGHELFAQECLSEHGDVLPWYLLTYAGRGIEGVYLELYAIVYLSMISCLTNPLISEDANEAAKDYPNAEIQLFNSAEKLICEWSKYCEQSSWSDGRTGKSESSE